MLPRRNHFAAVAMWALAAIAFAGETANPLDQAEVVLQVRDGRWVDREATRFAAAYNGDLSAVRSELAQALYRSVSFDGIDLTRPALIAWRTGKAPLLAVIPISDRATFLRSFGAVDIGEAPLVRTGERDGTVIYTQNQPQGLWEYRLLVAANVAYVARTAEECRRMVTAIAPPTPDPFAPPLEITLRNGSLASFRLPGQEWLDELPPLPIDLDELSLVRGMLGTAWRGIAADASALTFTARSSPQGDLQLSCKLTAKPDTMLAAWIAQQRPGTERLASQMRSKDTAILITGRLGFQGQFERWAFEQAEALRASATSHWTELVDTGFRGLCTLVERVGAWGISVERTGNATIQSWVVEHPRAVEMAQSSAQVVASLRGTSFEATPVGERTGFSVAIPNGMSLFLPGERHVVRIDDRGAKRSFTAAEDVLHRLDQTGSLDASPALVNVWIDLALAWNAPPPAEDEPNEPAILVGQLKPAGTGQLELTASVPLGRLASLLGKLAKTSTAP